MPSSQAPRSSPPVAACFLIKFDKKVGYCIAWKRALPGLELDGIEYKTLPSGLHNVDSDLLYFLHGGYAGVSLFNKAASTEAERNASFVAVGALVPKGHSLLGRAWLHAEKLRDLSNALLDSPDDVEQLERYWEEHGYAQMGDGADLAEEDLAMLFAQQDILAPSHPIRSITNYLDDFGPLIFPLYREALLRQRILLFQQPPLKTSCEFAYIISILSTITTTTIESLSDRSLADILPHFTVGIHDMPSLESDAKEAQNGGPVKHRDHPTSAGWVACSSDAILATKAKLSDVKINMPKSPETLQENRQWPDITTHSDTKIQATQRDLRRYVALRQGLLCMVAEMDLEREDDLDDRARLLFKKDPQSFEVNVPNEKAIVEPQSWAAIAYESYVWWASAGERSSDLQEEYDCDCGMLFTAADECAGARETYARQAVMHGDPDTTSRSPDTISTVVVAYFHRLTKVLFAILLDVVKSVESPESSDPVTISKEDLVAMGLDPWSNHDRVWVGKMIKLYFGREAEVQGGSVECCGVRVY